MGDGLAQRGLNFVYDDIAELYCLIYYLDIAVRTAGVCSSGLSVNMIVVVHMTVLYHAQQART